MGTNGHQNLKMTVEMRYQKVVTNLRNKMNPKSNGQHHWCLVKDMITILLAFTPTVVIHAVTTILELLDLTSRWIGIVFRPVITPTSLSCSRLSHAF